MTRLESFLDLVETLFRRYFLTLHFSYDSSDAIPGESYDITITPVKSNDSVSSSVLAITENSIKILKVDPKSYELLDEEIVVNSYLMLRLQVLRTIFFAIEPYVQTTFFEFLTRLLDSRINDPVDVLEYLLKLNNTEYTRQDKNVFIYGFGTVEVGVGEIRFTSENSISTKYQVDSETSAYAVISLITDQLATFHDGGSEYAVVLNEELESEPETVDGEPGSGADLGMDAGFGDSGFGGAGFGGGGDLDMDMGGDSLDLGDDLDLGDEPTP